MSFTRQSMISLALAGGYAAMALLISVLGARLMSLEQYGLYASVMGHILILTAVSSALPQLIVREITTADHWDDRGAVTGMINWSIGWVIATTLGIAAIAFAIRVVIEGHDTWWRVFWAGLFVLAAMGLLNVLGAVLRALNRPILSQLPASVLRPILQIMLLPAVAAITVLTAERAMVLLLVATFIATATAAVLAARELGNQPHVPMVHRHRIWALAVVTIGMMIACQRINQHLGTVMLQYLGTFDQVALYQPAVEALILTGLPALAVSLILMPRFRRALLSRHLAEQSALARHAARLVLAISAMASGALIGIGPSGLAAIFGPEFSAAYPGVAIVAAGQLVASLFGSPEVLMAQANREALVARIMGLGVVANIVATALLIPPMGAMGAAVATASALILIRVLLWRACRRELGFSSAVIG